MSVEIEMPQLSADGESGTLASWLVAVGDAVAQGDVIAELETDKSTLELEAPVAGTIAELVVTEGTEGVVPGTVLGRIENGASASAAEPVSEVESSRPAPTPVKASATAPDSALPVEPVSAPVESAASLVPEKSAPADAPEVRATPLARRAAAVHDVDLASVPGSGLGGRVVEADVLGQSGANTQGASGESSEAVPPAVSTASSLSSSPPAPEGLEGVEVQRLSAMRKTIARRMTESKQQVPHFYLGMRVSMDEVMAVRAQLNESLAEEGQGLKISVNDFVLRASALALRDVPAANVQFAGDVMHVFEDVDISVAVATEGGLVTPVVRNADRKGLTKLAEEVRSLALDAREGRLKPAQYQGGTFTISNLGMYGIETVYPILNPPQACILGVGAADEQPVVRNGEIGVGRVAVFTLAADHRAVDGAVGAELLAALRSRLEDPMGMIL